MPRSRTFDFFPIAVGKRARNEESNPTLSVYKNGQMVISRATNQHFGLNGKAVEFVWDEKKKALGMREVMHVYESPAWNKKTMRILKENEMNAIQLSVGKILTALKIEKENYKNLKIREWSSIVDFNRKTFYVILKHNDTNDGDTEETD